MGKYDKLYSLIVEIENENYKIGAVNAAIAILKEVINNIDNNGILPTKSKGYITEKFEIIISYAKK